MRTTKRQPLQHTEVTLALLGGSKNWHFFFPRNSRKAKAFFLTAVNLRKVEQEKKSIYFWRPPSRKKLETRMLNRLETGQTPTTVFRGKNHSFATRMIRAAGMIGSSELTDKHSDLKFTFLFRKSKCQKNCKMLSSTDTSWQPPGGVR
jgi:hypothetical protein